MYTLFAKLKFLLPHATSLKDKRQVCRSIVDRTRQRYNVSVAEVGTQDILQTLTLGVAIVSGEYRHGKNKLEEIIQFMEKNPETELISVEQDDA